VNTAIIKKSAIALVAVAVVTSGSIAATTGQAHAGKKHFGKALAVGIGTAIVLGAIHRNSDIDVRLDDDDEDCWTERRTFRDRWGDRYTRHVRICD